MSLQMELERVNRNLTRAEEQVASLQQLIDEHGTEMPEVASQWRFTKERAEKRAKSLAKQAEQIAKAIKK